MQLTLRTLIALRDKQLPAAEHEQLTRKLANSKAGQLLNKKIERILSKPTFIDQNYLDSSFEQLIEETSSADLVAQYIDNNVNEEIIEKFEVSAVSSDHLLLEIAECHQILSALSTVSAVTKPLARNEAQKLTSQIKKSLEEIYNQNIFDGCNSHAESENSEQTEGSEYKNKSWIVRCNNNQKSGPFNAVQLQQQINSKAVTLEDEVWEFGGNEWLPIRELVEPLALTFPSRLSRRLVTNKFQSAATSTVAASIGILILYFSLVNGTPISGQLVLAGGIQLPKGQITLKFHPLFRPRGAHELPPAEEVDVDSKDGSFSVPAKLSAGGMVRSGLHKVTVHTKDVGRSVQALIPSVYEKKTSTPLQVVVEQAKQLRLVIKPQSEIAPPIDQKLK